MSLNIAQRNAFNLASTLMVCVILFKAGDGYGVLPAAEYDGDVESVIHEYDPFPA